MRTLWRACKFLPCARGRDYSKGKSGYDDPKVEKKKKEHGISATGEDEYFYRQSKEQLSELKGQIDVEIHEHEQHLRKHQESIARLKKMREGQDKKKK